jgi:hypothetical protein
MNGAHVHLVLNHVPVLGTLFCVLALGVALLKKSDEVARAALFGLVLVALLTLPAYFSGEKAEDIVRRLPEVSTEIMEEHEEAALPALLTIEAAGVLALAALFVGRGGRPQARWAVLGALGLGVVGLGLAGRASNLGGQVHHSEVRPEGAGAAEGDHGGRGRGRGGDR